MQTIIRNTTLSSILIGDIGLLVMASESIDLDTLGFTKDVLDASDNLKEFVNDESIVVNDGIDDLGIEDGLDHLSLRSVYEDEESNTGWVPSGGTKHQVLVKASDGNFDIKWISVNDGTLVLDPIEIPLSIKTEERRWETLATYNFPGKLTLGGTPTKLDILNKIDRAELSGEFRIDSKGGVIAELSNLRNLDWTTDTDSTLRNLTDDPMVWEIQLRVRRKYAGYCFRVSSMTLRFD